MSEGSLTLMLITHLQIRNRFNFLAIRLWLELQDVWDKTQISALHIWILIILPILHANISQALADQTNRLL